MHRRPLRSRSSFVRRICAGVAVASVAWSIGCSTFGEPPPIPRSFPSGLERPAPAVESVRTISERGGHLDWCHAKNIVAFAHESHRSTSEIYTIKPDGSDERCVTCDNPHLEAGRKMTLPRDRGRVYRGAPAWHPSCEFMVIQVGTEHFKPRAYDRPPFGMNNALWLIAADGSWAEKIVDVEKHEGVMTPSFSDSGDRLFWSARERTHVKVNQSMLDRTPGAENPWDGWLLSIADFARPQGGPAQLTDRVDLFREEVGWFGATALTGDTIWYSRTEEGRRMVDEIYRAKTDGTGVAKVLEGGDTWEDQGQPSPWGTLVSYRSSLPYAWQKGARRSSLRLELWALTQDGSRVQLSEVNKPAAARRRAYVYDYAWGPDGREIAIFAARYEINEKPRLSIDILRLNDSF